MKTAVDITVGDVLTNRTLAKLYDRHFAVILGDRLSYVRKENRREHQKYQVVSELPTKDDYLKLKAKHYETTVGNLISGAYSEIESLAEEMREAYENMPESLQQADIGERRGEAADNLENIASDQPNVPDEVEAIIVVYYPSLDLSSRSRRAGEAVDMLNTAVQEIRDYVANLQEQHDDESEEELDVSELEELADHLENAASDLESVEFPGMYG